MTAGCSLRETEFGVTANRGSVDPVIGARGRLVLVFLHVDFEAFAIALVAPVCHFVADAEEEGAATEVDPADEHATEVAKVADIIAPRSKRPKEFDCAHDGNEGPHGNHDREREKPDLAIGEEDGVGDKDSEDRAGSADGGDIRGTMTPEEGDDLHKNGDQAGADAAEEEIVGEALLTPDEFQFAAEHPEHEHIDEQVKHAAVQKDVGERLPDAQAGNHASWDKPEQVIEPRGRTGGKKNLNQGLDKENARAGEDQVFDGGSDETTPIEADSRRAKPSAHRQSVRRCLALSQKRNSGGVMVPKEPF